MRTEHLKFNSSQTKLPIVFPHFPILLAYLRKKPLFLNLFQFSRILHPVSIRSKFLNSDFDFFSHSITNNQDVLLALLLKNIFRI